MPCDLSCEHIATACDKPRNLRHSPANKAHSAVKHHKESTFGGGTMSGSNAGFRGKRERCEVPPGEAGYLHLIYWELL